MANTPFGFVRCRNLHLNIPSSLPFQPRNLQSPSVSVHGISRRGLKFELASLQGREDE